MRILLFSPRQVWPVNSGAKLREYHLARGLSQHAEVGLLAFASAEVNSPETHLRDFLPFLSQIVTVAPPSRYTPAKLLQGLVSRQPLSLLNYNTATMRLALAQLLAQKSFDIIQVEGTPMAAYSLQLNGSGANIVYDWHNIESELMRRYAASTGGARSLYATMTARKLERVEREMLATGAAHIVCSGRERGQLLALAPRAQIHTVPNGVDVAYFNPSGNFSRAPHRVLFVGAMDYHANIEAALEFANRVWPRLQARFPQLRLTLAGANPTAAVRSLASLPGVEVTGTVPDLRPYYAEALAAVVPLRTGGGTRLKILEALAAGVPVVSTAVGAEGLDLIPGQHFLLAETPGQWQTALENIQNQPAFKQTLIDAGRELVGRIYDWSLRAEDLFRIYSHLLSRGPGRDAAENLPRNLQ